MAMHGPAARRAWPALILIAAVVLGGCAAHRGTTLPALGTDYAARERILAGIDTWQLRGRIGVRTADDGFSGALYWRQAGDAVSATLHGPLGAGAIQLDGDPHYMRLARGDGAIEEFPAPERTLRERYGWTVPVASFRYWVLGIADPASEAALDLGADGLLKGLSQDDWRVVFREYQVVAGEQLPKKLTAQNGDIRLTVSIRDWQFRE